MRKKLSYICENEKSFSAIQQRCRKKGISEFQLFSDCLLVRARVTSSSELHAQSLASFNYSQYHYFARRGRRKHQRPPKRRAPGANCQWFTNTPARWKAARDWIRLARWPLEFEPCRKQVIASIVGVRRRPPRRVAGQKIPSVVIRAWGNVERVRTQNRSCVRWRRWYRSRQTVRPQVEDRHVL